MGDFLKLLWSASGGCFQTNLIAIFQAILYIIFFGNYNYHILLLFSIKFLFFWETVLVTLLLGNRT